MNMRGLKYILALALILAVGSCKNRQSKQPKIEPLYSFNEEVADSLQLVRFEEGFEFDTVYFSGPYEIDRYFGWENGVRDDGAVPDIPGLIYRTVHGRHLAVRCPNQKHVLKWASHRIKEFADWCIHGPGDTIPSIVPLYENPRSDKDLIDYYMLRLTSDSLNVKSYPSEVSIYLEQFADLLVDVYSNDKYVTMQEYTWYDFSSCGDNTQRSWFTIDKKDGHVLELADIIDESKWQEFTYIMLKHLNAYGYPWFGTFWELRNSDLIPYVLNERDGCALTPDGVVVYFYPYAIGSGADGQFNALIPYSELEGMLKTRM